jgi:O-antigen/teichoic acid export membrane protein
MAYLWNQLGAFWLFAAAFLLALVEARTLGEVRYGVLTVALTAYNTATYAAAFGLEDAATVFVPRTLTKIGRAATSTLIRRLLIARVICLLIICVAFYWGIPALSQLLTTQGLPGARFLSGQLATLEFDSLALPLVVYVAGAGIWSMLASIFTAVLRTRLTLAVNGVAQVVSVAGVLLASRLGYGVVGVLWALAIVAWLATAVYLLRLLPLLRHWDQEARSTAAFGPVLRMGGAAWLTNLISGALLKQVAVSLLLYFAVSAAAIGFFNLAFQSSHAAAFLLIAGLGGVSMAAMSVAYAGADVVGLGAAWRTVSKLQILLAVPVLAFCLGQANTLVVLLYGSSFAVVGPLMGLFLLFNIAQRLAGGGAHQAALYVLGRQGLALATQWAGLVMTLALGVVLIPRGGVLGGPAGALIAVGTGQLGAELIQLALVWRFLQRTYPMRFGLRICLALTPAVLLSMFWPPAWLLHQRLSLGIVSLPASLINVTISGLVFTLLLLLGLLVAKPVEREDMQLLERLNPRLRPLLAPFVSGTTQ